MRYVCRTSSGSEYTGLVRDYQFFVDIYIHTCTCTQTDATKCITLLRIHVPVAYHFPRTVLISAARRSPTARVVMIASPKITNEHVPF